MTERKSQIGILNQTISRRDLLKGAAILAGGAYLATACENGQGIREFSSKTGRIFPLVWETPVTEGAVKSVASDKQSLYVNGWRKISKINKATGDIDWEVPDPTYSVYSRPVDFGNFGVYGQNLILADDFKVYSLNVENGGVNWVLNREAKNLILIFILRNEGPLYYEGALINTDNGQVLNEQSQADFTLVQSYNLDINLDQSTEEWLPTNLKYSYGGGFLNMRNLEHFTYPENTDSGTPYPFVVKDNIALFTLFKDGGRPEKKIVALDISNSKELWSHSGLEFPGAPLWLEYQNLRDLGDKVIAQRSPGEFYAIDLKSGDIVWEKELSGIPNGFFW